MGGLSRRAVATGLVAAGGLAGLGWWATRSGDDPALGYGACGPRLTPGDVKAGIDLGIRYLLAAQRPAGDFVFEVDWRTGVESKEANAVRQSAVAWALAEHGARTRDPAVLAAADRALGYWLDRARRVPDGMVFAYGDEYAGQLGTVALVGLALAERLRVPEGVDAERLARMQRALDGAAAFVRASRRPEGRFVENHVLNSGQREGGPSPYADGEALLLLATLAVRDGRADLLADTLTWAEQDWGILVRDARAAEPDSASTKGYYQWGSMAWARLVEGGHDPDLWSRRLRDLAVWMIEVHRTLERSRNTAYAYEGLLTAYADAKRVGDEDLARRIACVSHQGLRKLCSWQLGHPLALPDLQRPPDRFVGGVQNEADKPALRVDVTQHQVHALWLAQDTAVADHPL